MIGLLLTLLAAQSPSRSTSIPAPYIGTWSPAWAQCDFGKAEFGRLYVDADEFSIHRDVFHVYEAVPMQDGSLQMKVGYRAHDVEESEGFSKPFKVTFRMTAAGNALEMKIGDKADNWEKCPSPTASKI